MFLRSSLPTFIWIVHRVLLTFIIYFQCYFVVQYWNIPELLCECSWHHTFEKTMPEYSGNFSSLLSNQMLKTFLPLRTIVKPMTTRPLRMLYVGAYTVSLSLAYILYTPMRKSSPVWSVHPDFIICIIYYPLFARQARFLTLIMSDAINCSIILFYHI